MDLGRLGWLEYVLLLITLNLNSDNFSNSTIINMIIKRTIVTLTVSLIWESI